MASNGFPKNYEKGFVATKHTQSGCKHSETLIIKHPFLALILIQCLHFIYFRFLSLLICMQKEFKDQWLYHSDIWLYGLTLTIKNVNYLGLENPWIMESLYLILTSIIFPILAISWLCCIALCVYKGLVRHFHTPGRNTKVQVQKSILKVIF